MPRTMTGLDRGHGDLTLSWEPQNDAIVLPQIDKMLRAGFRFFKLDGTERVALTAIDQLAQARSIRVEDADLQALVAAGVLAVGGVSVTGETTGELAKTAAEVVASDTVVTPPMKGG